MPTRFFGTGLEPRPNGRIRRTNEKRIFTVADGYCANAAARRFARTRAERSFPRIDRRKRKRNSVHGDADGNLEELRPNRSGPGPVVPGAGEADSSSRPCRLRKSQNRGALVAGSRSTFGQRTGCRSLIPFSPHAMEIFVEDLRPCPLAARGGHDEVDSARTPLRFCDCPPRAAPRPPDSITEEPARDPAGRNATAARLAQLPADALRQTGVAGQAEQAVDIVVVAPRPVAAEVAVAANDGLRPTPSVRRCTPVPPPPLRSRAATANKPHGCRRTTADNSRSVRGRNVLLVAVQRVLGAVQPDLSRRRGRSQGTERLEDCPSPPCRPSCTVDLAGDVRLKPVQGARPGQRMVTVANPPLSGQVVARQRWQTVVPKFVVEILVTQAE